jgi:hypothetical protein
MRRLILLLSVLLAPAMQAQVITAASCSAADVQTAFNAVVAGTTTVNIPAGSCSWTSAVTLSIPSGNTSLAITGAGTCTGTGSTPTSPITCNDATTFIDNDTSADQYMIQIGSGVASSHLTISGVSFLGGAGGYKDQGVLAINGRSQNLHLTQIHINGDTYTSSGTGYTFAKLTGWLYGVTDHSRFEGPNAAGVITWMDQYGNTSDQAGNYAWADATAFGSSGFMFFENDSFYTSNASGSGFYENDCYAAKFVVRYSTFFNTGLDTHPTGGAGGLRGCRAFEIYHNYFQPPAAGTATDTTVLFDQSGTALVWGNTVSANYQSFLLLHETRADNTVYPQTAPPNGWGYCGTSFNGTGSPWDQSATTATGYACLDQIGRGKGDLILGYFPTACDTTTGCTTYNGSWSNQALEPVYEWMNTVAAGVSYIGQRAIDVPHIVQNRDYYTWCDPSSNSGCTTAFNGTQGTGSGLHSAIPATCTAGVAYWGTDTNTLYTCGAGNTWTAYYTPYQYPHPLDTQAASGPPISVTGGVKFAGGVVIQ